MISQISKKTARTTRPVYAYQRIEQDLRDKVQDGRLPAGSMLASRHNLAREYGVSLATAQQAISNLIADGTLEASDRRGTFVAYREATDSHIASPAMVREPRLPAVLRSSQQIGTLGIVATSRIRPAVQGGDTGSLWARQAIRSLEQEFAAAGGGIRFFNRYPEERGPYERGIDDSNAIPMAEAITALCAEGIVALAIVGFCDGKDMSDEIAAAVDVDQVPAVYMSWHEMRAPLAQVYYDNRSAGYQAAQHLLRRGYSRLLFLAPFEEEWLAERIRGAEDATRHAGLPPEALQTYPAHRMRGVYTTESADKHAYELAKQFFLSPNSAGTAPQTTVGVIAPNDFTAYSVLRAAAEEGKIMGRDFGLIGFDDDARSYALGLTTVRPPIEAMGEEAGRLLLRSLHGERSGLLVRLRSQVIPRASTDLPIRMSSVASNHVTQKEMLSFANGGSKHTKLQKEIQQ